MKPKAIIFSASMVTALKRRAKTVTRRLVTAREPWADLVSVGRGRALFDPRIEEHRALMAKACPYGYEVGQPLYVRENLTLSGASGTEWRYAADDGVVWMDTSSPLYLSAVSWVHHKQGEFCPSIHMPRFASRFLLELTEPVRVERLSAITDEDALREGISPTWTSPRERFAHLWDELNLDRAPWHRDPWVFRIAFRVAEGPGAEAASTNATPARAVQEATP